ncbi:MAG: sugar ABC transporter substrate-binding protein [Erysipelotrichaceae bacterium]|nr:sugar ABC transporter substrate-binding protein [Erysipelotrichaceae bacterium]
MKKLLLVLLAIMCVLTLAGCSSAPADSSGEEETTETDTIKIGVVQLVQHAALDAATEGFYETVKAAFPDADINVLNASGDSANCSTIVQGFLNDEVDLIMANATPALQAAESATADIPILGTSVTEYGVALGIENFNGLVGTNVSGTSDLAPLDQQAQMILDLFPETKTVGIIFCSSEANSKYQVDVVTKCLEEKGISVIASSFTDSNDIAMVTEDLCSQVDVIYIPTDNQAASCSETIANVVLDKKVPVIAGEEGICSLCGVATLTINYYDLGCLTGEMAVKILKGEAKIEEMPIEYFPDPVKKFNPEVCDLLGVSVPEDFEPIE